MSSTLHRRAVAHSLSPDSWVCWRVRRSHGGLTDDRKVVILMVMSETMPLAKVKAHLSEVVDRVTASHERISITRHGHREAVVIAADDLDALATAATRVVAAPC